MFEQKMLSVAFYGVMALVATTCILCLDASYRTLSSQTIAAWVQAVGSIGAIAGAAWIASAQQRTAEQERRRTAALKRKIIATRVRGWAGEIWAKSIIITTDDMAEFFFKSCLAENTGEREAAIALLVVKESLPIGIPEVSTVDTVDIAEAVILLLQKIETFRSSVSGFRPRNLSPDQARGQWNVLRRTHGEIGLVAKRLFFNLREDAGGLEINRLLGP